MVKRRHDRTSSPEEKIKKLQKTIKTLIMENEVNCGLIEQLRAKLKVANKRIDHLNTLCNFGYEKRSMTTLEDVKKITGEN